LSLIALHPQMTEESLGQGWLESFHAGDRQALESFYRDHYAAVDRAVGQVLAGADRETVVHEVFLRVLASPDLRQRLTGGSPAAWIGAIARNHAIDFRRRRGREVLGGDADGRHEPHHPSGDGAGDARMLIERFCREVLPEKWRPVFETCFVRQMTQRDAARELGLSRTTLLYQQHRVSALLRRFLLESEGEP
jgi:RNA polymerase sigma-70 factor (ECF subfamily)